MAEVDLYGGDAERIRNQYRTSLGRDASNDEVSGWLSGRYGGGNTDNWLTQIQNSDEARNVRTVGQTPNVSGPQNTSWGTHTSWDPATGLGDPASGYGAGGVTNPAYIADQSNNRQIADWYQDALGRAPGQDDVAKWLSGTYGWGDAQNLQGIRSGIYGSPEARARQQSAGGGGAAGGGGTTTGGGQAIPGNPMDWFMSLVNGKPSTPEYLESIAPQLAQYGIKIGSKGDRGWSDTIILPDGRTFDVIEAAGIGQGKRWTWQQNGGPGYTAPQAPGTQYSDPYTKFLEQLLQGRIGNLMQPVQDPNRAMYDAMLKQRADSLSRMSPELDKQIAYLESRFKDLQGTGYTGAEGEAIRTGALDPIETDRQAARKRVVERLSQRGLTPDSGIAQQALLEVDKAFDAMRGATQTALTTEDLQRREGRQQRAEGIRSTLSQIPEGRAREQLDVYSAINTLSQLARAEDEARQREAVGYGGALADLGPQRLQLAMQAAGAGGNPSSMFQNLMQLAGLNQNAALYGAQNQSQLWSGLGAIAETLMRSGR